MDGLKGCCLVFTLPGYLSIVEFSKIIIIEVSWNSYWLTTPLTALYVIKVVSATFKIFLLSTVILRAE